jgi:hypothetical protein
MNLQQRDSGCDAVHKWGCCFLCDCYLAGLDNEQCDDAFTVALDNKWVRSDAYVLDHENLISGLSSHYGTSTRSGERKYITIKGGKHFFVMSGGKCVYNSADGWNGSPRVGKSWS